MSLTEGLLDVLRLTLLVRVVVLLLAVVLVVQLRTLLLGLVLRLLLVAARVSAVCSTPWGQRQRRLLHNRDVG